MRKRSKLHLGRRPLLASLLATGIARAADLPTIRLGLLPFGSVQWIADVISRHGLDRAHGFALQTSTLANTEAAKIALMGNAVDVATSDWPFVAVQRSKGGHLCFAASGSNSLGGLMVPSGSPVHRLADLRGLRLGVAGGAADKSWLLVRAAAHREGIDLMRDATLSYGAPPLLEATLKHGSLDALLTFWNFAARLEAGGFREALSVATCARSLGIASPPVLVGFVFDEHWADANRPAIQGFLAATRAAADLLAASPPEWGRIRPLMNAPDDKLFASLRDRFIAGVSHPSVAQLRTQAAQLQPLLASGDLPGALPAGVFWPDG